MSTGLRFILGYQCNAHCAFCYQKEHLSDFLPYRQFRKNLEKLNVSVPPAYITVMGGEPTLDPDLTKKLRAIARQWPETPISLTSNGTAYLYEYANWLTDIETLHTTFSLPVAMPWFFDKIEPLSRRFPQRSSRVNAFFKTGLWQPYYHLAKAHNLRLTFCSDQRLPDPGDWEHRFDAWGFRAELRGKYCVVYHDPDGFEFWLFHQGEDYFSEDNLIVLPDGTLTLEYTDVLAGKGAIA